MPLRVIRSYRGQASSYWAGGAHELFRICCRTAVDALAAELALEEIHVYLHMYTHARNMSPHM